MASQKAIFPRDTGLQVRMLVTLFLLGLLYVALVGVCSPPAPGATVMIVVIGALTFAQLFLSDKLALRSMGARRSRPRRPRGCTR